MLEEIEQVLGVPWRVLREPAQLKMTHWGFFCEREVRIGSVAKTSRNGRTPIR